MRLFIAANIPGEIKESLYRLTTSLESKIPGLRWVKAKNLHITLQFLGDVTEKRAEKLKKTLSEVAKGTAPFTISFEGLGAFPDLKRPHVLWVGVKDGTLELKELAYKLRTQVWQDKDEKEFSSHVTIGRVRSPAVRDISFPDAGASFGSFRLTHIDLMQSVTYSEGPEYSCIESFPLGGIS